MAEMTVGAEHDLGHYAVETVLGMRRAFYGLLADGMDIADFNVAAATTKIDIPTEAIHAEFIVGLLQMERASGAPFEDFNAQLRQSAANARKPGPPPPHITAEQLAVIRAKLDDLMARWLALPPDGTLELTFPADPPNHHA